MAESEQIRTKAPSYCVDTASYATHEVLNQAGALVDYNAYSSDKALVAAAKVFGVGRTKSSARGRSLEARRCSISRGRPTGICRN